MRAGNLTDIIQFYSLSNSKSASGALLQNKSLVLSSRCQIISNSGKNMILNKEDFNSNYLEVKVRFNQLINDSLQVELRGKIYKIENTFYNRKDNSISITLKKKDD